METTKTRIAIIGLGIIGECHLEEYAKIEDAEVVAACDILRERLDDVCNRFNIAARYENIYDMLDAGGFEAVDVALHNCLHAPVAIECMRRGYEVYCEKPMAGSYADAKAIYDAAKKYGRKLHIQLATLYSQETEIARRLIEAGDLGHIYHAHSYGFRRRGRPYVDGYARKEFVNTEWSGGGALFDMGVYHIAQILFLLGNPKPTHITGNIYSEVPVDPRRGEISKYNVEEFAVGHVNFANNLTMSVTEAWAVHMGAFEGSYILGSKAGVRLAPFSFHSNIHDFQFDATADMGAAAYRERNLFPEQLKFRGSQRHWIAVLRGECELLPTAEIALNTQLIQEGIYISQRLGRQVTADEVVAMSQSNAREIPNLFPKGA